MPKQKDGKIEPLEAKTLEQRMQKGFEMEVNKEYVDGIESTTVQFMNLEDPNVPLEFTFNRGAKRGQTTPHKYILYSGRVYTMPKDVADHINSKAYPIYENTYDAEQQQYRSVITGMRPRFTCHPVQQKKKQQQSQQKIEAPAQ
jgi:hypothetical protein